MKRQSNLAPCLLLLPHALFFAVFVLFPVGKALVMSCFEWGIFNGATAFVGADNYLRLFDAADIRARYYWESVAVTLQFVLYTVPLFVAAGLALALLLNSGRLKFRGFHVSAVFIPTALAVTVVASLWRMIFNDSGFVNSLVMLSGGDKIGWLSDLPWVWITLVATTLWWTVGWNAIIFIGGLQKIPDSLYDAAKVDGAGWWATLRAVTLPGLRNVMFYVVTVQTLASWGLFAQSQLMTKGFPERSTLSVMLNIFGTAFGSAGDMLGLSSSMAIMTGLLILGSTTVLFILFGREPAAARKEARP